MKRLVSILFILSSVTIFSQMTRIDSLIHKMKDRWEFYTDFNVLTHDSFPQLFLIENIITPEKYEDFQIVEYIDGKFKFYITETMKLNIEGMHYIRSIQFLKLECNDLPFLEVITSTNKGHGSYYLYTIENHQLYLCAHVSKIVDRHHESKNRSWIYFKGALYAQFKDLDKDSYPDLIIQGWRKLVDVKGEELQTYKIRREYVWDDWDYRFVDR